MDFYDVLKAKYSANMTKMEFSLAINDIENELFSHNPELLMLTEAEQNDKVEQAYKRSWYVTKPKFQP